MEEGESGDFQHLLLLCLFMRPPRGTILDKLCWEGDKDRGR